MGPAVGSGGIDGRRRLLAVPFESPLDMPCTKAPVGDRERGSVHERALELGLEPAGDNLREYGGGGAEGTPVDGFGD